MKYNGPTFIAVSSLAAVIGCGNSQNTANSAGASGTGPGVVNGSNGGASNGGSGGGSTGTAGNGGTSPTAGGTGGTAGSSGAPSSAGMSSVAGRAGSAGAPASSAGSASFSEGGASGSGTGAGGGSAGAAVTGGLTLTVDPNPNSVLSCFVSWKTDQPANSVVQFGETGYDWEISDDTMVTDHKVLVIGMHASKSYMLKAISGSASGTGTFMTGALPATIPTGTVMIDDTTKSQAGWTLMNVQKGNGTTNARSDYPPMAVMYDASGEPVWYVIDGTNPDSAAPFPRSSPTRACSSVRRGT